MIKQRIVEVELIHALATVIYLLVLVIVELLLLATVKIGHRLVEITLNVKGIMEEPRASAKIGLAQVAHVMDIRLLALVIQEPLSLATAKIELPHAVVEIQQVVLVMVDVLVMLKRDLVRRLCYARRYSRNI